MKRILFLIFCVSLIGGLNAQTAVTFVVDIAGAGLTPDANGVHIAGNFADPNYDGSVVNPGYTNWSPSAMAMTDNGNGAFSITLNLLPEQYEFKFVNGNDWTFVEDVPNICQFELNGNDNRFIEVGSDPMTYAVCFASCALCGTNSVLFRVDMSMVDNDGDGINAEIGQDISPNGVHVAGSFNGWNPAATALTPMGNNIYGVVVPLTEGDFQYKFINGNTWGFEEASSESCFTNGSRVLTVDNPNIILDAVCFGNCSSCIPPTSVTFRLNMGNETVSSNGVHIAGSFQNWDPGASDWAMTAVGNNIYELAKFIQPGSYQFQFVNGNSWTNQLEVIPIECQIGGNREIVIAGSEMIAEFCFGSCNSDCSSFGCTNPQACNFNPNATSDDESCLFTGNPCNDNNSNTFNDVVTDACTCIGTQYLNGCLDPLACNFNANANVDDSTCNYLNNPCDDNLYYTINDIITDSCICQGTPYDVNGNNEESFRGLSYQAVVRDNVGIPLVSQAIEVRFTLHQNTLSGPIEYQETQVLSTNEFGLFSTVFGIGNASIGVFQNINWGYDSKFIEVEVQTNQGGWIYMGTQQLSAVPYAIRAKQVEPNGLKLQSPNGNCYILQVNNAGQLSTIAVPCD